MNRVLCYGHRGMGSSIPGSLSKFPENMISSFKEALRHHSDGIELDVFLSGRGEIIVMHGNSSNNSMNMTTLKFENGAFKTFSPGESCEKLELHSKEVFVKRPWATLCGSKNHIGEGFSTLSDTEKKDVISSYIEMTDPWRVNEHSEFERVTTLESVFKEFGNRFRYNIELKGTRSELGVKVLELLRGYPGLDVIISSFMWVPPPLKSGSPFRNNPLELEPNGPVESDLLRPLVNNSLKIPLALIFNNTSSSLPSINRIIECAKKYNAKWVCVVHDFWKHENSILGLDIPHGDEAVLRHLVESLHKEGFMVLSYWPESSPDKKEDFLIHIRSKLDAICPNDVESAMCILRKN